MVHHDICLFVSLVFTEASPYFESFKRNKREVLFVYNPIDEVCITKLSCYVVT